MERVDRVPAELADLLGNRVLNERKQRATGESGRASALPGRPAPIRLSRVAAVTIALAAVACGGPGAGPKAFPGSAESLADLGERVLGGLTARDTAALNSLRLTKAEHNDVVWPELPAARPEVNFPVDYAWTNIQLRNRRALARLFPRLAGVEAAVTGVECRGDVQAFRTFQVHTDCWVRFRTGGGEEVEAQLFKDALERDGGYKIFRYYEEPYHVLNEDGEGSARLSDGSAAETPGHSP